MQGSNHWRFHQEYQHLEVDVDKWFTLSEKAQQAHIRKVLTESLGSVQRYIEVAEESNKEDGQKLSVNYESLINIAVIPTNSLQDIWEKASTLSSSAGLVVSVPGQSSSHNRIVASAHGEPHYILCKPSGQFVCSGICPRYSAYKICQHTDTHNLSKFCCEWWKKHCHIADMESLTMSGLPKGVAGQKGGVAKCSRRGRTRSSISTVSIRIHDCTSCVTSIQSQSVIANSSTVNLGYVHTLSTMPQPSGSCDPPPSGSYGPLSSGSYDPPPPGSYGPLSSGSYDSPPSGSYGPPSSGSYGPLSSGSYDPPPPGSYGPLSSGSYDSPPSGSYGPPSSGSYGPPPSGSYGPSSSSGSYGPYYTHQFQQYSPHGGQPYVLKFLTKQIRVCAGCRLRYCNTEKVPAPPYNICVAHKETQQINNSHTGVPFTTKTTAHYHANPCCI